MMDMKTGERAIEKYPLAYSSDATPYQKFRFDSPVREFCDRDIMTPKNHLRVAKCVVVGDIAVGKTCMINRFGYHVFTNNYKATIGVDFDVQKFSILDIPFNLQVGVPLTTLLSSFVRSLIRSVVCSLYLPRYRNLVIILHFHHDEKIQYQFMSSFFSLSPPPRSVGKRGSQ